MSVSSIIDSTTGKIYNDLIPQGGGVPLQKGGLITADAQGKEQPLAVSANNGWVLSANSGNPLGLEYIQLPAGGINFTQEGQLLYAGQAPAYADSLLNIGNAGQVLGIGAGVPAWIDLGGSGQISANPPLLEEADPAPNSKISINFSANIGEIPYGNGTAKVGAFTNVPVAGDILGMAGNPPVPTWINAPANVGTIVYRNSVDNVPLIIQPPPTSNSTCILTADRTYHDFNQQVKNTPSTAGTPVSALNTDITFFTWTAPADILITSFTANVYIQANATIPDQLTDDGTCSLCDATGTTTLLGSQVSSWNIINAGQIAFPSLAGTYQAVSGTTYTFVFSVSNIQGVNPTIDLIDTGAGNYSGTLTIVGTEYAGTPATFTLNPPNKFRNTNSLTGFTSITCESFTSQSWVATGQQSGYVDWIMVGGQNGGVGLVP
jgi:hypothetical protein